MTQFFRPYEGKRPFVFISYSHRDTARVLSVITALHRDKLRLWYDEGIPAGRDWSGNIDAHMRACGAVLFFRSETALASPNCLSEIDTAVKRRTPLLIVPLDDAPIPPQWEALLLTGTTLSLPSPTDEAIQAGVKAWTVLNRSFYKKRGEGFRFDRLGLVAALLLLLLTLGALYGVLTGRIDPFARSAEAVTPKPTAAPTPTATATQASTPSPTPDVSGYEDLLPVTFGGSEKLEAAVRDAIGKSEGDVLTHELNGVTNLLLVGNMYLDGMEDVHFDTDGTCRVGRSAVIEGDVAKLSVIGRMPYLKRLALIRQPIEDLSPLNGLVLLEELWLSGTEISDLSALNDLPALSVLHLEHTAVRDLSALSAFPSLTVVTVSVDMLPLYFPGDAPYAVRVVR